MMALDIAHIVGTRVRQAQNHRFNQSLLHRSRYLGLCEYVRGGFREMGRRFVQLSHRDRTDAGGAKPRAKVAGANSRPIIASPAAVRSSGAKDMEPHPQGAEDRRYHSRSSPFLEI